MFFGGYCCSVFYFIYIFIVSAVLGFKARRSQLEFFLMRLRAFVNSELLELRGIRLEIIRAWALA